MRRRKKNRKKRRRRPIYKGMKRKIVRREQENEE